MNYRTLHIKQQAPVARKRKANTAKNTAKWSFLGPLKGSYRAEKALLRKANMHRQHRVQVVKNARPTVERIIENENLQTSSNARVLQMLYYSLQNLEYLNTYLV